jgi:adenosylhomocysteine nucleosidase
LNRVGVVAALAGEARALGPLNSPGGSERALALAVSGIGRVAAGAAARLLVETRVSALMTFGMAGGLDPALQAGSIIFPSLIVSRDGARYVTSRTWRERLSGALGDVPISTGSLLTSTHALQSPAEKAAAFRDTGAVAVDMESAAVAEVAADRGLPFIAVRVIVDSAADSLPPCVIAASRAGGVQIGRLLAGLVAAPSDLAALIRLAHRYRAAMRSLRAIGAQLQ